MKKDLVLKKFELDNYLLDENVNYMTLTEVLMFLNDNCNKFENEESIEAIARIKKFIELYNKEHSKYELKYDSLQSDLMKSCNHEVMIKNYDQAICLICDDWVFTKDIDFNHILIDHELNDFKYNEISILKIICEIIGNDEDIFEVFESYLESKNMNDIKVLRRIK